ncbi:MAG TPA: AraC family transcriptional regulator ligand-binding domain-containing protein, partial [Pseudomonadales bacterium]|nr:AraC family transcriptional regulator ligand-binding domain-containing protein [Pseudomonadales bacterium]
NSTTYNPIKYNRIPSNYPKSVILSYQKRIKDVLALTLEEPTLSGETKINTLPGRYIDVLLELCERWGVNRTQLLARSPLAKLDLKSADTRISLSELNWFVQRAQQLCQQPALGIYAAAALKLSTHGFFGFALLSSATLAEALTLLDQFVLLQSGPFYFQREQQDSQQILRLRCREIIPAALENLYAEAILLTVAYIATDITEQPLRDFFVRLKSPQPAYYASLEKALPCPLDYGSNDNALHFPNYFLDFRIKHANEASFQLAKMQCEQTLKKLAAHDQIENRVRALLSCDLSRPPGLPELAEHCHLSTRSLKRKLAERGTGYTSLLEEIRMQAALSYFTEENLQIKEVARRLGFSSTTNFSRAFKKWTGKSPRQYRHSAEAEAD